MSERPKLLDLFAGAGGAGMGYHRAGFDVTGVDSAPQPHYPFRFIQADALTFPLDGYDVIHASPPCQGFTALRAMYNRRSHPDALTPMRERLQGNGRPWIIENVPGAPMRNMVILCGSMFGLGVDGAELRRHRWFEIEPHPVFMPWCAHVQGRRVIGVYGGHGRDRRRVVNTQDFSQAQRAAAMGIDWMTRDELDQAIPPAYTHWIGTQLMAALRHIAEVAS